MFKAILEKWACRHQWKEFRIAEKHSTITNNLIEVTVYLVCDQCGKLKKLVIK